MDYVHLGRSGLKVSRLCLGTMNFGPQTALEKYEALCDKLEMPPGDVALAWLLENPVVTAPIVGPRTMDQLEAAHRALGCKLDDSTMKELDALFPGPGGPAPEAYAW